MQRTHFTAGYTPYNCVCDQKKKKKKSVIVFFQNRYLIMVKCLNIGKNISKPIYRSISNFKSDTNRINMTTNPKCKQSANYCDLFIYLYITVKQGWFKEQCHKLTLSH